MEERQEDRIIQSLLTKQKLGVLATIRDGRPHASLMAFVCTPDLRRLLFITHRQSRKYHELLAAVSVSMLIDDRINSHNDPNILSALTASGPASEIAISEKADGVSLYINRHPHLQSFAYDISAALICLTIESCLLAAGGPSGKVSFRHCN